MEIVSRFMEYYWDTPEHAILRRIVEYIWRFVLEKSLCTQSLLGYLYEFETVLTAKQMMETWLGEFQRKEYTIRIVDILSKNLWR